VWSIYQNVLAWEQKALKPPSNPSSRDTRDVVVVPRAVLASEAVTRSESKLLEGHTLRAPFFVVRNAVAHRGRVRMMLWGTQESRPPFLESLQYQADAILESLNRLRKRAMPKAEASPTLAP